MQFRMLQKTIITYNSACLLLALSMSVSRFCGCLCVSLPSLLLFLVALCAISWLMEACAELKYQEFSGREKKTLGIRV